MLLEQVVAEPVQVRLLVVVRAALQVQILELPIVERGRLAVVAPNLLLPDLDPGMRAVAVIVAWEAQRQ